MPYLAHLSASLSSPLVNPLTTLMCSSGAASDLSSNSSSSLAASMSSYLSGQPALQRRHPAATVRGIQELGLAPGDIRRLADLAVWYTLAGIPRNIIKTTARPTPPRRRRNVDDDNDDDDSSNGSKLYLASSPTVARPLALPHCTPRFLRTAVVSGARRLRQRQAPFDEQIPLRGNPLTPFWMLTPTELEATPAPAAAAPAAPDTITTTTTDDASHSPQPPPAASASDLPPPSPVWFWSFRFGFGDCYLSPFSSASAVDCLLGRKLYFRGDSLTRYQFLSLAWFLHFGEWPESFLGSDTEGPNITDEHEFPSTTPAPEFKKAKSEEKRWRNFFSYLRVVFGTAISVRDVDTSASKLELLLYRHPVLDIELGLKTHYGMPTSNPPWPEWQADFEVYAPRTPWETNRAARVRAYTDKYRQLTRQQRREARSKQIKECAAAEEEQPADATPSSSPSSPLPSPLLPSLPALTPLASEVDGPGCDSASWCPDVVLINHGLHYLNLHPHVLGPDHPVVVSLQALLDGWSTHYPRSLFVWKTTTPPQGTSKADTHALAPHIHANELVYIRMIEAAAAAGTAKAIVLDAYQIASSLLTRRDSSDGTFPAPTLIPPYWDPWHPWPLLHESINLVMLRMLCQRRGELDHACQEQAGDTTTFEERFVIDV